MPLSFRLTGVNKFINRIGRLDASIARETVDNIGQMMNQMIDEMRKNILDNDSVATGVLYDSLKLDERIRGRNFTFRLTCDTYDLAPDGRDYAEVVEEGAPERGFPPMENIIQWIEAKGIQPYDENLSENQLAFIIARAISQSAQEPKPFFKPAVDKFQPLIIEMLQDTLDRLVDADDATE